MAEKSWVDFAQFTLNLFLAIVTVSLFIQGTRDRRRIAEDRRREQTSKISVHRFDRTEQTRPNSWRVLGTRVEIRNDSDASISRVHAVHLTLPWWHDYVNARGKAGVDPYQRQAIRCAGHAEPGVNDISIPPGQNVHYDDAPLSGQTILLYFTDGAGIQWVKRDGQLWRCTTDTHWLSRLYQWMYYKRGTQWLVGWLLPYARRRFNNLAPTVPLSARVATFLLGTTPVPGGASEPWLMPLKAPKKDWPYQEWINGIYLDRAGNTDAAAEHANAGKTPQP